jgi:hypothetical protein
VSLEGLRAFVDLVSTYFTAVADVKAMQFVEPIWDLRENVNDEKIYILTKN